MANEKHLAIINQGVDAWNRWRKEHADTRPDLSGADLPDANLTWANLSKANLNGAILKGTNLENEQKRQRSEEEVQRSEEEARQEADVEKEKSRAPRRPQIMTYDVFISFKNLDEKGVPTRDAELANEVYKFLTSRGLASSSVP